MAVTNATGPAVRVIAGRYELRRPVGRGGMGEVWAGFDNHLDRPIAVKLLRRDRLPLDVTGDGASQPTEARVLIERFVREARFTARVEHPGVPAVYDAGGDRGELYLVMQLVRGTTLSELIAEGEFSVEQGVAVAAQIASILAAAHQVSLVHRDLKPNNVMVSSSGEVSVLDFGIAAVLEPEVARLTREGETMGSPSYMAPEQVVNGQLSPRTDLYALGCVVYEMLTGEPPFTGDTSYAVMERHVNEEPPALHSMRGDVPAAVEALVSELLAKDPADRPADAASVYERLTPYLPPPEPASGDSFGAHDPRRPFRRPLAPFDRTNLPVLPRQVRHSTPLPAVDLSTVQRDAAELVEAGRVTQAAELLSAALASLPEPDRIGAAGLELRFVRANTRLFGEDYRAALFDFQQVLAELEPGDERVQYVRSQIAVCRGAIGETADALDELKDLLDDQIARLGDHHAEVFELRQQIALLSATSGDVDSAVEQLGSLIADVSAEGSAYESDVDELRQLLAHLRRMSGS